MFLNDSDLYLKVAFFIVEHDSNLYWVYTMEYYSAIKKLIWFSSNEIDETRAHYTEWSKSER